MNLNRKKGARWRRRKRSDGSSHVLINKITVTKAIYMILFGMVCYMMSLNVTKVRATFNVKNDIVVTNNDVISNGKVKVKQEELLRKRIIGTSVADAVGDDDDGNKDDDDETIEKIEKRGNLRNNNDNNDDNDDKMTTHDHFPYYGTAIIDPSYKPLGGGRYEQWKNGETVHHTSEQSNTLARQRRIHIKNAMIHSWKGYEEHAFGMDNLHPVSGKGNNAFGEVSLTLLDSLDTLWLMNMTDEFKRARDRVKKSVHFKSPRDEISLFETTIRCLGGLLAAYDWSGDDMFLKKATTLQRKLYKAFHPQDVFPHPNINLSNARTLNREASISEVGSLQLEMRFLAEATDNAYASLITKRFDKSFEKLRSIHPKDGLYAMYGFKGSANTGKITFGGGTDSFYEYMLKLWLQGDKKEDMYREMYDKAIDGMHLKLLRKSSPSGLWFIGEGDSNIMEHLACFMGGNE